ncbi:MAG: GNAT family N-acetyltransferase [Actinomycetes bacterium]
MKNGITKVAVGDVADLVPLMLAYCEFYEVEPGQERLGELSVALIANPSEGVQLIARGEDGTPVGFATVYWTWQTLSASRAGVMNDLFVTPEARAAGWADALIEACAEECRARDITSLVWQTALDNSRAQAVYERVGAVAERWLDYSLDVTRRTDGQLPGS